MSDKKTCGDFGGVKANGEPCTRPAGWGRDTNKGKCKAHADVKDEKMQSIKKEFLEYLENNVTTLKKAAKQVGKSEPTIWRWRKNDEEFDEAVEEAKAEQDRKRLERVEDSMFKRIINGGASASEVIFWLKNRGRHRWSNNPDTVVNVSQKQVQGELVNRLRTYFDEEESKE